MTTVPRYTATTVTAADGSVSNSPPLHFDLNTDPDPVRISPSTGDPRRADFVMVGSRRSGTAIECRKITITVPTGTNSPDLTPDLASVSAQISLPGWTPITNTATKTITFTPASGHTEIGRDQGVTVQLMGMRINTEIGSAPLRIDLEWREAGYDDPWDVGTTIFDIGKFPPSFHLANFMADQLIIDNGDSVNLDWEASGVSSLRLLYDVADVNVLDKTTYPINDLGHTTVFYLRATVQVGNNTVERTLSVTVTVRVPDLEVGNLIVRGDLMALNELTVGAPTADVPTVSASKDPDPQFPVENMLDGDLETYYRSKTAVDWTDYITFDFGTTRRISAVDIYFGDTSGGNFSPVGDLRFSVDGVGWSSPTVYNKGTREFHYTARDSPEVRFIQLYFWGSAPFLAIRSFQVSWATPLRISAADADFGVPVTARLGITDH
ncbi:hypothetical protein ABIA39_003347 [Nocardia sp. GAS34]|uniref:discoidin domain-containing protein n=1 Tax=unclassified Nocardia TaxID=2637762 RepID=UPI003D21989D